MNFLVLYSTIEDQTRKIAEAVASHLESQNHMVVLTDANQIGFVDPGTSDAAILCAPVHIGRYPAAFVHFVRDWCGVLNGMPSAFVSVSLSIASADEEEMREARNYPLKLMEDTGWKPQAILNCAGALKYTEYDFFKRWMLKRIAAAEGGPIDTKHDYEFTNWTDIKRFVNDFSRSLTKNATWQASKSNVWLGRTSTSHCRGHNHGMVCCTRCYKLWGPADVFDANPDHDLHCSIGAVANSRVVV